MVVVVCRAWVPVKPVGKRELPKPATILSIIGELWQGCMHETVST